MTQCSVTAGCPVPTTRPCASNYWIRSTSSTVFEKLSSEGPWVGRLPNETRRDSSKAQFRTARGKPPHGSLTIALYCSSRLFSRPFSTHEDSAPEHRGHTRVDPRSTWQQGPS